MLLRLELCLQCPSVRERGEDLEQVVDEASVLLSAAGTCLPYTDRFSFPEEAMW